MCWAKHSISIVLIALSSMGLASNFTSIYPNYGKSYGLSTYHSLQQFNNSLLFERDPAKSVEVSYMLTGDGSKLWHSYYNFPEFGVSYAFTDLGNRPILGYAHSLFMKIHLPLYRQNKINTSLLVAPGLSYVDRIFHPITNSNNLAISNHLNTHIKLGLKADFKVSTNLLMGAGIHLVHFSNGTVKKPNAGLNYSMVSLGITYIVAASSLKDKSADYPFSDERNRFVVVGAGSYKEIKNAGGPKYGVYTLSLEYSNPIKALWRFGFSADFMNDNSHKKILLDEGIDWRNEFELFKVGTAITSEVVLNRLSGVFYFGGYLYNKSTRIINPPLYQRIGLRYRISSNSWAHVALKTHWNIADYVEFGIAVKL
jgi:hypothetical protein